MRLCYFFLICALFANRGLFSTPDDRLCTLQTYVSQAHTYRDHGRYDLALRTYFAGLALNPDIIDLQFGKELDASSFDMITRIDSLELPLETQVLEGSDLTGKTLLIYYKKGHGDTIQFSRYLPRLIATHNPAKILFVPQKPLLKLFKDSLACLGNRIEIVNEDEIASLTYDMHMHLLSVPKFLNAGLDDIPLTDYYLLAQNKLLPDFGPSCLRVGLIWQGDPSHIHDKDRSIPLEQFAPLREILGITLYSLQTHNGLEQIQGEWTNDLVDLGKNIRSFADTAAFMEQMDVVVTIDSAGAHLACALGKQNIILIPKYPDLRWVGNDSTNPWNQHSLLLRQSQYGDWSTEIEKLKNILEELLCSPAS